MKKYYVSLDTAKLLREKKFNSWCEWVYEVTDEKVKITDADFLSHSNPNLPKNCYAMALLYQAQVWLRENYEIDVVVYPITTTEGNFPATLSGYSPWICLHPKGIITKCDDNISEQCMIKYPTYEDAFDKGLQLALDLI